MVCEFRQTLDGFGPQRRRVPCNFGLARLFDAPHSPVQGRDEFLELTGELRHAYRHGDQ